MHFAILPILLLIARPVFAATPLTFEEVDTSGDGLVSIDEVVVINELNFNAADTDRDGTLGIDEYGIAVGTWLPPDGARPPNLLEEEAPPPPKP